ncbi:MAG: SRPBCC family protein [Byssovorax sp.]
MKILKRIGLGLAVVLVLFILVVATRPSSFHVERSATIKAPPAAARAAVADFHGWQAWSPWEKLDPGMKKTFTGPASGTGAVYEWVGNDKVGEGRMTITEATADKVTIRLEFIKPFASTNTTTFTFTPSGSETKVTWAMDGHNDFMGKAFSMFMDMDKMVGGDFERGLAALKQVAESAPAPAAPPT